MIVILHILGSLGLFVLLQITLDACAFPKLEGNEFSRNLYLCDSSWTQTDWGCSPFLHVTLKACGMPEVRTYWYQSKGKNEKSVCLGPMPWQGKRGSPVHSSKGTVERRYLKYPTWRKDIEKEVSAKLWQILLPGSKLVTEWRRLKPHPRESLPSGRGLALSSHFWYFWIRAYHNPKMLF